VLVEQAGDLVGDVFAPGVANVVRKGKRHGGRADAAAAKRSSAWWYSPTA
jgi:hypothetical protein